LNIPVRNSTRVDLITHKPTVGGFRIVTSSTAADAQQQQQQVLYARKVVLATGIQVRHGLVVCSKHTESCHDNGIVLYNTHIYVMPVCWACELLVTQAAASTATATADIFNTVNSDHVHCHSLG
jgi:hypothetical protein